MNCIECPLQAACDAYRMLDEMEDNLAHEQVEQAVTAELNADVSSQDYFDSMLMNARYEGEVRAAVLLAESCERTTQTVADLAKRGFALVDLFAQTRRVREEKEKMLCPGPVTEHRFLFFGKIIVDCGSTARKKRLGEVS